LFKKKTKHDKKPSIIPIWGRNTFHIFHIGTWGLTSLEGMAQPQTRIGASEGALQGAAASMYNF
jgi:hypothetical protein